MRAVNQALGRVIRHKNDFGAVILADERFAHESSRNQLSLWLRPSIQNHVDFSSAIRGLREFFRNHATSTKLVVHCAKYVGSTAFLAVVRVVTGYAQPRNMRCKLDCTASWKSRGQPRDASHLGDGSALPHPTEVEQPSTVVRSWRVCATN